MIVYNRFSGAPVKIRPGLLRRLKINRSPYATPTEMRRRRVPAPVRPPLDQVSSGHWAYVVDRP